VSGETTWDGKISGLPRRLDDVCGLSFPPTKTQQPKPKGRDSGKAFNKRGFWLNFFFRPSMAPTPGENFGRTFFFDNANAFPYPSIKTGFSFFVLLLPNLSPSTLCVYTTQTYPNHQAWEKARIVEKTCFRKESVGRVYGLWTISLTCLRATTKTMYHSFHRTAKQASGAGRPVLVRRFLFFFLTLPFLSPSPSLYLVRQVVMCV